MTPRALWRRWVALFEDDGPQEPFYDPVHLAAVLIGCLVAFGALFWLLWTLLVYEGGLAAGPRPANLGALLLCAVVLAVLHRADRRA